MHAPKQIISKLIDEDELYSDKQKALYVEYKEKTKNDTKESEPIPDTDPIPSNATSNTTISANSTS